MRIVQNNQNFQSKKIPRYLYHFTNQNAYASMLRSGSIEPCHIDPYISKDGVFTLELSNFIKHWKHSKDWDEKSEPLQESLLRNVVKWVRSVAESKSKLVILRIPTANLDHEKLKVRSLNKFFKLKMYGDGKTKPDEHLQGFTPASEARRYKNRKEAVEYIYQDEIPIDLVERIGEIVDIPALRCSEEYNRQNPALSILSNALMGTQEFKGLKNLTYIRSSM